jgi:uncharacterized oxidoreductase
MPTLPAETLTDFAAALLRGAGVPDDEAQTVAASLVGANLRGHDSHGVMRVPQYVGFFETGQYRAGVDLLVERETPALVVCDAQWGFGQVQAHRLLDRVIPKARALGVAAGSARDCGHIGRLGEYAERAAGLGLLLIATANNGGSSPRVAPPGGTEPRLATNPLCAGFPTDAEPVVLDFGTSVVAEGKVRVHYINRTPVPEGWLLDAEGRPTADPAVLYEPPLGSIRPMGGGQSFKGFGLGLLIDVLSSGLAGGRCAHPGSGPARGNNVFFLLLDPDLFAGRDDLVREASGLVRYVRETPRAPGVEAITLPGDPERATLARRAAHGVPLEDAHWQKLVELARRLGTPVPGFAEN